MRLKWRSKRQAQGKTRSLDDGGCDHELTQTTAGAGIVRVSCRRCHAVGLKPGGWMPSSGNVKARREIGDAHQKARARVHQAVTNSREHTRQQLVSAAARQQTRERQLRQHEDQALLERAWQPLQELLLQRWQDPATRRLWIEQLLEQAARVLVDTTWKIRHPPDWPGDERGTVESRLVKLHGYSPVFSAQPSIRAGLLIVAEHTRVDGTIDGLLHDRSRIEALLLARLNECRVASSTGGDTE